MWVTAVLVVALVVLLLDVRYYHMWAYPLYIIGIVVMIGVLIAGKEVNGAKSWIELGSLRIQPVGIRQDRHGAGTGARDEQLLASRSTASAICCAWVRSSVSRCCSPFCKNDTGSGIVLGAFLFVLYRERTQQVALHPDSAHRCALHRFVPADAHDAAGAADPDLRGVGGDDERPMAFAHRLPRLAGALGHRPRRSWDSSPPARWTSTAAC